MWRGICCASLAGCALESTLGTEPVEAPESFPEAPEVVSEPVDSGAPPPEVRVYALYERVVEEVENPSPLESGTADGLTHAVKRLVWQVGASTYQEQLCATWGNKVFGTTWSFVADFAEQRGILDRVATITDDQFVAGPYLDLLGTDVQSGPLPVQTDDPGVVDSDGDGLPGVTLFIANDTLGSGELYVAQRSTTTLTGTWRDSFHASGSIAAEAETSNLDATTWWLNLEGPPNTPRPEKNFFNVVRIDEALDCEGIYLQREELGLLVEP